MKKIKTISDNKISTLLSIPISTLRNWKKSNRYVKYIYFTLKNETKESLKNKISLLQDQDILKLNHKTQLQNSVIADCLNLNISTIESWSNSSSNMNNVYRIFKSLNYKKIRRLSIATINEEFLTSNYLTEVTKKISIKKDIFLRWNNKKFKKETVFKILSNLSLEEITLLLNMKASLNSSQIQQEYFIPLKTQYLWKQSFGWRSTLYELISKELI